MVSTFKCDSAEMNYKLNCQEAPLFCQLIYSIVTTGPGQLNGLVRWTGYRFVVRQSLRCMFQTPACACARHFTTLSSSVDRGVYVGPVGRN